MTSTNMQIGFGSDIKSSSKCVKDDMRIESSTRVLKPPGGGSSDIFGGNGYDTPRSGNKNHLASNIFAQPEGTVSNNGLTPRRGRNNDSHSRLFGEPDRSGIPAKNHLRSNIPIGGDETDRKSSVSSVPSKTSVISNGHSNGKMENGGSQQNINNGNKESEETRQLNGEQNDLDNLDTRSVRSHQSTESLLLANNNPSSALPDNELNQDNNDISDCKSEISVDNNNKITSDNIDTSDAVSVKEPDNVSRIQNNNIFGDSSQASLKSGRRNMESRNCVTGVGIESPQYTARKFGSRRDVGNPVTGEGYTGSRNGLDSNTQNAAVNGANQVINKNRVPPGGFSSGLW